MVSVQDQAFLQILREEKNLTNFLDAFFGFLYRCTDFYVESSPEQKLGFPKGLADKLVLNSIQKWRNIYNCSHKMGLPKDRNVDTQNNVLPRVDSMKIQQDFDIPQVAQEVEIEETKERQVDERIPGPLFEKCLSSDSYNGAARENYTWSQTISDINVLIKIPRSLKTAKNIRVNLDAKRIKVEAKTSVTMEEQETHECNSLWTMIFEGEFCHKIRKDESVWSIIPGQCVTIHLEKASEMWWEALIIGEPKIELSKIDCSRNLDEMGLEEQMKIQELMWNHQRKLLGKTTAEEIRMEETLKQAWNVKGSPFEGTPYDPSVFKFN